jgi:uncharacterized protein (DUF58 family)
MRSIKPTDFVLKLFGLLWLVSIVVLFYPELKIYVLGLNLFFCGLVIFDFLTLRRAADIVIERQLAGTVPLGISTPVLLKIVNRDHKHYKVEVIDHYPVQHQVKNLPCSIEIEPNQGLEVTYFLTPLERGLSNFGLVNYRYSSLLGMWKRHAFGGATQELKVYPNYREVMKYGLLAAEQRLSQMGIVKKRNRGQGTEFHQLRDFRKGDRLGDIDWKSSARMQRIISRDYQMEKDQQIIFMVDCGRRMRSFDGDLSHFDHSLNAMLLLTYVATRQGDAVGMMTFAGPKRWLPPQKSKSNVNRFLNTLYDLNPTTEASDYISAAESLNALSKKRAMVVILSNVRDEDDNDLQEAVNILKKRHLVIFAALKEEIFQEQEKMPLNSFEDSLTYCSLEHYLTEREELLNKYRHRIITLDTTPTNLHVTLVNSYFAIKSSNIL